VYIDHNIVNVSALTQVFPNVYGYLGLEVPFNVLIMPIPRAIWPEKPLGLTVTIAAALGEYTSGMTLSSTYIGEAYMAAGYFGVVFASLLLGALSQLWNRFGNHENSQLAHLLYASGFFCAAITMRSLFWCMQAMLPTLAIWTYARWRSLRAVGVRYRH
jgi:hypothetical protein